MKLPLPIDYQQALQTPSVAFLDKALQRSQPRLTPLGLPATASGGFALTFDVTVDNVRYAIRCFHKQGNQLQERYAEIAKFVRSSRLDFLVDVDYLPEGIRVGGSVYPIVRMRWVDGTRLDDWIDDHLHEPDAVHSMRTNVAQAVATLRRHGAAHGDLQHGNILVRSDGSIRLVDYDGMYLPALRKYGAAEQGHRNYQHAERSAQYDDSLDLFAAAVIDLSLTASAHDPKLWKEFNQNRASGESLLFTAADFADPAASPVFAHLARVPRLAGVAERLRRACEVSFDAIPLALAGDPVPAAAQRRSRTAPASSMIFRATDRSTLLARQGDEVTVVGMIVATKSIRGLRGTITLLNFGDYRRGDFTAVAFGKASQDLGQVFGDPQRLVGQWVAITGLLTAYQRSVVNPQTPQIELRRARMLRTLTPAEAAVLLATPATGSSKAAPSPPVSNLDDRLGKLYSSPTFATSKTPQSPPPSTSRTGPVTSKTAASSTSPPPAAKPAKANSPKSKPAAPTPPPRPPRYTPTPPYTAPTPPAAPPYAPRGPATPYTATPYSAAPYAKPTYTGAGDGIGLGVAALIAGLCMPPAGIALGVVALSSGNRQSQTGRICAWIGLAVGALSTLICVCQLAVIVLGSTPQ